MSTNRQDTQKEIVLLAISLAFSAALAYGLTGQPGILIRSDHYSRWYASYQLVTQGRSIYDPRNGEEVVALNPNPTNPLEGSFFYPAHLLLLTLPLVGFPYPVAHLIWLFLIQSFLIAGLYVLIKAVGWPRSPNSIAVVMLLSILFIPNFQNTIWGQFNTVGVISLALVLLALRNDRLVLAGFLALGLTFKPQNMLLTLVFLVVWSASQRKRWRFLLGLAGACFGAWLFAECLEPHWITSFLQGVRAYSAFLHPDGILAHLSPGGAGVMNLVLALLVLWVFYQNRRHEAAGISFSLCLVFSLAAGWLLVPLFGMIQLVAMPLAAVLLLSALKEVHLPLYRVSLAAILALYVLGLIGFIFGLSRPELYGLHVVYSELAYRSSGTILLALLSTLGMYLVRRRQDANPHPQV